MEIIVLTRQVGNDKLRVSLIDKIYKVGLLEMATSYLDLNLVRSLSFFICLAQVSSTKFIDYLRTKYREHPSENLQIKLSKKFCLGSEEMQTDIV
jgi:hypothetical protein